MRKTIPTLVVYLAGATAWVYAGLNVDATWHQPAVFTAVLIFHGLIGLAIGRWWCIALPMYALLIAVLAGHAGGNPGGDFNTVFDYVLIEAPFAAAALAVGVVVRRIVER